MKQIFGFIVIATLLLGAAACSSGTPAPLPPATAQPTVAPPVATETPEVTNISQTMPTKESDATCTVQNFRTGEKLQVFVGDKEVKFRFTRPDFTCEKVLNLTSGELKDQDSNIDARPSGMFSVVGIPAGTYDPTTQKYEVDNGCH